MPNGNQNNQRPKIRRERSAGAICYRRKGRTVLVYFQIDSYHKWAAPKGRIHPGEQDQAAALRELEEETGLSGGVIEGDLGTIVLKFRRKGVNVSKTVHYFLVRVPWNSKVVVQKREHGRGERIYGYRWIPAKRAADVSDYENMRPVVVGALAKLGEKFGKKNNLK